MTKRDVEREGWSAEKLGEESASEDATEIGRRLRRGDETRGDPDARDVAGAVPFEETPQGREHQDLERIKTVMNEVNEIQPGSSRLKEKSDE